MNRVQRVLVISIIVAAIAIAVAAIRLATLGGDAGTSAEAPDAPAESADPVARRAPAPVRAAKIVIKRGIPAGGPADLRVRRGEVLKLTVVSRGAEDEVHVHGYDLRQDVTPDRPARFRFVATITGEFDVELETVGVKLADLEVTP